jgi:hypothetical protein
MVEIAESYITRIRLEGVSVGEEPGVYFPRQS